MTDETTTGPNVMAGDVITQPGLYESRGGDIMPIIGWGDGWWVSELNGTRDWYGSDGRQRFGGGLDCSNPWQLLHWVGPLAASEPDPETTTEQLAEIEGQATEYTPPNGWRLLEVGETLTLGDEIVQSDDGRRYPTERVGSIVGANQRYIRQIEPQPQPEPEPQAEPDADQRIRLLKPASYAQAETILRLQVEKRDLNMEIRGLRRQLAVAKAELTTAAAVSLQLQIELDAAQQVPADSPELRQLRSDLAEVAHDRDTYRHAHELLVQDLNAAHERTRAMTVEAIVEWLQPFRGCNSPSLALLLLEALPDIIRSIVGLDSREEID